MRKSLSSVLILVCSAALSFGQIGVGVDVNVNAKVEVKDLKQILDTLDRFRAQIDATTKDGGDLAKRIDQLKEDMSGLIDKADKATGRLESKVVLDFIEQREATFKDLFRLEKKVFGDTHGALRDLQSGMMSVPASFNLFADRFGRDFALQLTGITPLLPFGGGDHLLDSQGTRLAFQARGKYPTTTFVLKEAFGVGLRMNDKIYQPTPGSRFETRIGFEFPASQFAEQFFDTDENPISIDLVDHDKKDAVRYTGCLVLEPLFPVEYSLRARGPKGEVRNLIIDHGPALLGILQTATDSMQKRGASPEEIARRHGQIYQLAEKRLAYGSSEVQAPPGFEDWELTLPNGAPIKLDRNQPWIDQSGDHWTLRVREVAVRLPNDSTVSLLTIDVLPKP